MYNRNLNIFVLYKISVQSFFSPTLWLTATAVLVHQQPKYLFFFLNFAHLTHMYLCKLAGQESIQDFFFQNKPASPAIIQDNPSVQSSDCVLRLRDNSPLSSRQPRLSSLLFTPCVHRVFEVPVTVCYHSRSCPNSIVSHSTLLSTSPLNKLSCPLPGPVDFAEGSGEQQWFSYLLFVILSAVCISLQTSADCNTSPF